mmetsp:Transcript_10830/g.25185  ORF Transcript_10830/g.25185 Transcript_10830/m.25185 type:complete len:220 (+) Transcript_10830:278-937(+)
MPIKTTTSHRAIIHLGCKSQLILLVLVIISAIDAQLQPSQCIASPCLYSGECRDRSGLCGDTVAHCNAESQWVPACGGGGNLKKPQAAQQVNTPIASPTQSSAGTPQQAASSFEPTTLWQGWLGREKGSGGNKNEGVAGLTTGNESDERFEKPNYNTTGLNGWDAGQWDGSARGSGEEEKGWLDKINPFGNDEDEDSSSRCNSLGVIMWIAIAMAISLF